MNKDVEARLIAAKRLFVDVDETLIKHTVNDWNFPIWVVEGWKRNAAVAHAVWIFGMLEADRTASLEGTKKTVVIWSGGGREYAENIAGLCLEGVRGLVALEFWDKDNITPEPGDLFIDDDPLPSFASATIHPREFE